MNWIKLGQIYKVSSQNTDLVSHAANPLAVHLQEDIFRVFFSGRNATNKSSVSFVDIDILNLKVVSQPNLTVFRHGDENSFFSHGVSIGNLYEANGENYILFMGWQIRGESHWRGDIGRLRLIENERLDLYPSSVFMGVDEEDTISLSYPWVIQEKGVFKMWYGSTLNWTSENGEMIHVIKYATSVDGSNWQKHGVAIPYEIGVAQAFSRPTVWLHDGVYHMWYSYRSGNGTPYRIGYSTSADGIKWVNHLAKSGITVSETGWDSEMVCYPFVFTHKQKIYMLYNGNEHGKHGFGLAVLAQ